MQGKKIMTPQLFYYLSLDEMFPEDNFYRKVNVNLSLGFLYKATASYYGKYGQESIDPVDRTHLQSEEGFKIYHQKSPPKYPTDEPSKMKFVV